MLQGWTAPKAKGPNPRTTQIPIRKTGSKIDRNRPTGASRASDEIATGLCILSHTPEYLSTNGENRGESIFAQD
jgi:hypothetical protein